MINFISDKFKFSMIFKAKDINPIFIALISTGCGLLILSHSLIPVIIVVVLLITSTWCLTTYNFDLLVLTLLLLIVFFLLRRYDTFLMVSKGGILFTTSFITGILVLGLLLLKSLYRQKRQPAFINHRNKYFSLSFISFFSFIVIGLLSSLLNAFNFQSFMSSLYAMFYFVLPIAYVFLLPRIGINATDIDFFILILIALGVVISVLLISSAFQSDYFMQVLKWKTFGSGGSEDFVRSKLPFGGATGVGAVITLIIPLCYFQYFIQKSIFMKRFVLMASITMTIGAVVTLSRSTLLILCIYILSIFLNKKSLKLKHQLIFVTVIIISIVTLGIKYDLSRYTMTDTLGRTKMWSTAMLVIRDNPVFGVGPNTIYKRVDSIRKKYSYLRNEELVHKYLSTSYKGHWSLYNPHNSYLWIMAEYGLTGFFLFLYIVISMMNELIKSLRSNFLTKKDRYVIKGFFLGTIGFLIQNLKGSFLINNHRIAIPFWIYIGIALCYAQLIKISSQTKKTYQIEK